MDGNARSLSFLKTHRFDIQTQRDARDAEAKITLAKEEKLALLIEDVEFYRPFYDEVTTIILAEQTKSFRFYMGYAGYGYQRGYC